jgi:hypothetical protein
MALFLISASLIIYDVGVNLLHLPGNNGIHIHISNETKMCHESNSTVFYLSSQLDVACDYQCAPYVRIDDNKIFATPSSQSSLNICFGESISGETVFAFGENFSGIKDGVICIFEIPLTSSIVLDGTLLWDMAANSHLSSAYRDQWPIMCGSMEAALQAWDNAASTPFKFTTLQEDIYVEGSASFWLDFCQIDNSVVTVRHRRTDHTLLSGNESPCTVKQVWNTSPSAQAEDPPLCLEDVLSLAGDFRKTGTVVYMSAVSVLWSSSDSQNPSASSLFSDLVAVIVAFQNVAPQGGGVVLEVRSFLGGLWAELLSRSIASSDSGGAVSAIATGSDVSSSMRLGLYRLAHARNAEDWAVAVASSLFQWSEWFSAGASRVGQVRSRLELVQGLDHLGLHLKSDVCGHHRQSQPEALWSHMCREEAARIQLGELLSLVPNYTTSIHSVMNHISALSRDMTATSMTGFRHLRSNFLPFAPPPPLPVSRTHIGVLIFVAHGDVYAATQIVQGWKEGCPHCILASHFVIFPTSLDEAAPPGEQHLAAMRLVLNTASAWMIRMSVRDDLVAVLVGMDALRAFRHPGQPHGAGLIPAVVLGKEAMLRLPHPIVFATDDNNRQGLLDSRAFAGQSSEVRRMIRSVLSNSGSTYTDRGTEVALTEYAFVHRDLVAVDAQKDFFDFSLSTQDPVATSRLRPFSGREVMSSWPSRRLRTGADLQVTSKIITIFICDILWLCCVASL